MNADKLKTFTKLLTTALQVKLMVLKKKLWPMVQCSVKFHHTLTSFYILKVNTNEPQKLLNILAVIL